jgi:hypothetical protein
MITFDNLAYEMARRMAEEQLDIDRVSDDPVRSQPSPPHRFVDTRGLLIGLGCLVCGLLALSAYA